MKKFLFLVFLLFELCCTTDTARKKVILVSKASKPYIDWLICDSIILINAYNSTNIDCLVTLADAVVLTGGEDINPNFYGDSSNFPLCGPIDFYRDTLESNLFNLAFKKKLPLLGICRGMQMINVMSGGTLYGDIPTEVGNTTLHRNYGEVMHDIIVNTANIYYRNLIFPNDKDTFIVNSFHHQALKRIASNIHIIATSSDGIAEAAVMDTSIHPFMISVQFHPERLPDNNTISNQIKYSFLNAIFN